MNSVETVRVFVWQKVVFRLESGETRVRPGRSSLIEHTPPILKKIGQCAVYHEDERHAITWNFGIPLSENKRLLAHAALVETFGEESAQDFSWYGVETRIETREAVALGIYVQ